MNNLELWQGICQSYRFLKEEGRVGGEAEYSLIQEGEKWL